MVGHAKRARHGFTLTEVLVVTVVICLLVGALLAVLGSTRKAAARTTCTNQLRQLATAMDMYRQQHGALPPHSYLGRRSTGEVGMITWQEILRPHVGPEEMFLCPSDPDTPPMSEQPVWDGRCWMHSSSYEYHQGLLQQARSYEPQEDPEQEEMRKESLTEATAAARHRILFICRHHDSGPRRAYEEKERPRRRLIAHEDGSVTWGPLPDGL
jgi:prepilin-type N-terminal cleavage/methylation domain-containing protein